MNTITAASSSAESAPAPRFRDLLSKQDWRSLPSATRRRFSHQLAADQTVVFTGKNTLVRLSKAGWLLAQAARLIGSPLPTREDSGLASVVSVTQGAVPASQIWSRQYGRQGAFPQVIHSLKRFAGPTGLEEIIGCGIGMALTLSVDRGRLLFCSEHFFIGLAGWRLRLPLC